jgi:hypothetical protein
MRKVMARSTNQTKAEMKTHVSATTAVDSRNCSRVGHDTFFISLETSLKKDLIA